MTEGIVETPAGLTPEAVGGSSEKFLKALIEKTRIVNEGTSQALQTIFNEQKKKHESIRTISAGLGGGVAATAAFALQPSIEPYLSRLKDSAPVEVALYLGITLVGSRIVVKAADVLFKEQGYRNAIQTARERLGLLAQTGVEIVPNKTETVKPKGQ
jgi:hypothetical protein